MGPEARLWRSLKTILDRRGAHSTRIENRSGGGIPDVHIVLAGKAFWVELKSQVKSCKPVEVKIYNLLRTTQKAWHASYSAAGGRSYILLRTEVQGPRSKKTDKNSAIADDIGAIFGDPGPRSSDRVCKFANLQGSGRSCKNLQDSGGPSAITDTSSGIADSGFGVRGPRASGPRGSGTGPRTTDHRHWYTVGSGRAVGPSGIRGSGVEGSGIIYEGPDLEAVLDAIMDDLP